MKENIGDVDRQTGGVVDAVLRDVTLCTGVDDGMHVLRAVWNVE